jgi:DNA-binding CsgD family transcriptional regulator
LQPYAVSVAAALPALIPADVTVFGLANLRDPSLQSAENPRLTSAADLETYMRVGQQSPDPLWAHYGTSDDVEARRVTDLVSRRQFRNHPLYAEFYRRLRIEFILGARVNTSPRAFDGIMLNRGRKDFSERDRSLLTLIRPHIVQGYWTAIAVDRARADLVLALDAMESPGFGLIILTERGRIQLVSPSAPALLASYFGSRRWINGLPDALHRWVRRRMDALRDASRLPTPDVPLIVKRDNGRLVVRLMRVGRNTSLMLDAIDERQRAKLPVHYLTPHEVKLLKLLVRGHSYKTAAAALGSSVNTVAFHVKHIYDKLNVHSKAQAVAKALRDGIVE